MEYRAGKPRPRPQRVLALGLCGPSMASVRQEGAFESQHRKNKPHRFVWARARGAQTLSEQRLDFSGQGAQRSEASQFPASVFLHVNHTGTLSSQGPSSSEDSGFRILSHARRLG